MNVSKFEKIRREISRKRSQNIRILWISGLALLFIISLYLYNAILFSYTRGMGVGSSKVSFSEWKSQVNRLFSDIKKKSPFSGMSCTTIQEPPRQAFKAWERIINDVIDEKTAADILLSRQTMLKAPKFSEERILLTGLRLINAAKMSNRLGYFQNRKKDSFAPRILLLNGGAIEWGYTGDSKKTLGEIVQWTDLFSALIVLGADVTFVTQRDDLPLIFCPLTSNKFDMIITDYIGAFSLDQAIAVSDSTTSNFVSKSRSMQNDGKEGPSALTVAIDSKTWILDYFGTDAERNYAIYNEEDKNNLYCCRQLPLNRFLTAYNRPQNTFLGGMVLSTKREEIETIQKKKREKTVVIYGKFCSFLNNNVFGARKLISLFKTLGWKVVDTFHIEDAEMTHCDLPSDSQHLGILNQSQIFELMSTSRILLGLGRPLIGPMPLEAVAAGMVVMLPRYQTPLSCTEDEDLSIKPIECNPLEWTSQHPKLEEMANKKGSKYVKVVDFNDIETVSKIAKEVALMKDEEFVDRLGVVSEFEAESFLKRVDDILKSVVLDE